MHFEESKSEGPRLSVTPRLGEQLDSDPRLSSVERMLVCVGIPSRVKTPGFGGWCELPCHPLSLSHAACGPSPDLTSLLFAPPSPRQQRSVSSAALTMAPSFVWEKETTNLVRVLQGDESVVPAARTIHTPATASWHQWHRPCCAALEPPAGGEGAGRVAEARPGGKKRAGCSARPQLSLCGRDGKGVTASGGKGLPGRSSLPQGSKLRQGRSQRVLKAQMARGQVQGHIQRARCEGEPHTREAVAQ